MKKKLLILPSWYPSSASSINGIFVQDQALVLSKEYDVAVLFPRLVGWPQIIGMKVGPKSQDREETGVRVYEERAWLPIPRCPELACHNYAKAAQRGFERVFATWGKPDMIHAHVVLPAGLVSVDLKKQYGIPIVLTEHSGPFSMHLRTRYQRRVVKATLENVDCIIAVSPAMAKQIHAFDAEVEVSVIGNVVKTQFFLPSGEKTEGSLHPTTRFLSVTLMSKQKGLSYLLEAARLLTERGQKAFELVFGGDGPERFHLERAARALGVGERCRFLGLLDPSEVRSWMQQCDVVVLSSLQETFGIVLGEAMSCGKPVIATRSGGPEFVVTPQTGVLVDVGNASALAEAMEGFISGRFRYDPQVIRKTVVERFGEQSFLHHVSRIYEQVWLKS